MSPAPVSGPRATPGAPRRPIVPPAAPPWLWAAAGLAATGGLALWRLVAPGPLNAPACLAGHALAAAGLTALASEAARLQGFRRAHPPDGDGAFDDPEGWPRRLAARALVGRLKGHVGQEQVSKRLDEAAALTAREYAARWWPHWVLAFVPMPLAFVEVARAARAGALGFDAALPWLVALIVSGVWLAAATALAVGADRVVERWRAAAFDQLRLKARLLHSLLENPDLLPSDPGDVEGDEPLPGSDEDDDHDEAGGAGASSGQGTTGGAAHDGNGADAATDGSPFDAIFRDLMQGKGGGAEARLSEKDVD